MHRKAVSDISVSPPTPLISYWRPKEQLTPPAATPRSSSSAALISAPILRYSTPSRPTSRPNHPPPPMPMTVTAKGSEGEEKPSSKRTGSRPKGRLIATRVARPLRVTAPSPISGTARLKPVVMESASISRMGPLPLPKDRKRDIVDRKASASPKTTSPISTCMSLARPEPAVKPIRSRMT